MEGHRSPHDFLEPFDILYAHALTLAQAIEKTPMSCMDRLLELAGIEHFSSMDIAHISIKNLLSTITRTAPASIEIRDEKQHARSLVEIIVLFNAHLAAFEPNFPSAWECVLRKDKQPSVRLVPRPPSC